MSYDRWSTQHIPPRHRGEFWRDAGRQAQTPVTPVIGVPEAFEATLTTRSLGAVVINRVQVQSAHDVQRLREDLARGGQPSLIVDLYLAGRAQVSLSGRGQAHAAFIAAPGVPFLLNADCEYRLAHLGPIDMLALVVPQALMEQRGGPARALAAGPLPGRASLQLLAHQMRLLGQWTEDLPAAEARRLADLMAGTLDAVLSPAVDADGLSAARERHFLSGRVRQLIALHYHDPALSPSLIAARMGISARTLHAHMALHGTSFGAELMGYRLERAHALLRGARMGATTVMEVAVRCGFVSAAHFSRRFRARYGVSPAGVLRESGGLADAEFAPADL